MSLSVADKLQSQQDLLMKRLEEIEKRENEVLLTLQLVGDAQAHLCLGRIYPNLIE
jgi:hypothetical protein